MNIGLCSEHNGKLRVSKRDFAGQGIGWRFITDAIRELVAAGLLAVTSGKSNGLKNPPNFYRLTFLGTIHGPATWRPQSSETAALSNRKRKVKPMPAEIFSPAMKGDPGSGHERCLSKADLPAMKGDPIEANSPAMKGDPFIIFLASNAEASLPLSPSNSPPNGTIGSNGSARASQVIAYAVAHAAWIARYGLPTHAEAGLLRACYRLGETTAAEWAVIERYLRPRDNKPPEAFYMATGGDRIWIIFDADRKPIDHARFELRMDAWRHVDRLRDVGRCGPAVDMPSPEVLSMPIWRLRPRLTRGH